MKRVVLGLALALGLFANQAAAQAVTYYIDSAPYSTASNSTAVVCPAGDCSRVYTTAHKLSGQFELAGAPPPNEIGYDVSFGINTFTINDGQRTYTEADLYNTVYINTAKVDTNAAGEIIGFEFKFDRVNTPGSYPVSAPANPAARVSSIWFTSVGATPVNVLSNAICQVRGDNAEDGFGNPTGGTFGAGCLNASGGPADGVSFASAASVTVSLTPPPPPVPTVPTLSEWAMILFGGLLAMGAVMHLHHRRQING
ncbi:MAG TPA: IPTL-CTERM sorting domain-containing protein [Brevundimonas sp.]|uniref:IPTL-CTERM sorting domain-containing protein n=1 Tax=Brevundimonas sp. TaxID=1871086 RepID=UPI002618B70D|nr:IPTL-CTERM sorting domain-containing protein [Brevundimonas sp.]HRO33492.1 IPTL-CTERM sorting domain-containing protein [Brevundimonas sp.]